MRKLAIGITDDNGKTVQLYNGETLTANEIDEIKRLHETTIVLEDADSSLDKTSEYRLVMQTQVDNTQYYLEFDMISSVSVTSTSELTEHPLVSGDTIADHMYRKPASMTVSGKFSLQGNKRYPYNGAGERLANIQDLFERIKNEGILSRLITVKGSSASSLRFKERTNMALTSISWTEHLNSLEFTFTFDEVLMADVQTVEYEEDVTDPNLPAITDASTLDFTDTLLNWNEIDEIIVKQLYSLELLTADFLEYALDVAKSFAVGAGTGIVVASAITLIGIKVLVTLAGSLAAIPVYGWIALAVIAVACVVGFAIAAIVKAIKRKNIEQEYKITQFKLYQDDRKNQQEVERFCNYLGNIHQNLEYLEDVMQVYAISTNEPQECMTYIDDNYYIFRFMKNNVDNCWTLTVLDVENNVKGELTNLESAALADISQCNTSNAIFRTPGSGFYVYAVNKRIDADLNNGASQEDLEKQGHDLTNYCILVSQTNMETFNTMLTEIVVDAMKR